MSKIDMLNRQRRVNELTMTLGDLVSLSASFEWHRGKRDAHVTLYTSCVATNTSLSGPLPLVLVVRHNAVQSTRYRQLVIRCGGRGCFSTAYPARSVIGR